MTLLTVTLTWDFTDAMQAGETGFLQAAPTGTPWLNPAGETIVSGEPLTQPFTGGPGSLAGIIANDNGLTPAGQGYQVTVRTAGGATLYSQAVVLNHAAGASQDLSALSPAEIAPALQVSLPLPSGTPQAGQVPAYTGPGNATEWATPPTATLTVRAVSSAATLAASDGLLLIDATAGNIPVGLPAPATVTGQVFWLKRTDTAVSYVTITPFAAETIDGAARAYIANSAATAGLVSDGTNWWSI